jgi:hypothetical protein
VEQTLWDRDGRLLREIAMRLEAEGPGVDPRRVADAIGMSHEDADRAAVRLNDAGMLKALRGDDRVMSVHGLTSTGLRESGEWPGGTEQAAQALLAAIDEAADKAPDAQERSKIKAFGSAFAALGTNAGGGIAAAAFAKLMGWV